VTKDATRAIATDIGQNVLTEGQIKGYVLGCIHTNKTVQGAAAEITARWITDRREARRQGYMDGRDTAEAIEELLIKKEEAPKDGA
jgi:hypothetical protein